MIRVTNIQRISTDSAGNQGNSGSFIPTFNTDGTKLLFESYASNLVAGDTNNAQEIFLKDIASGAISRIATDIAGNQLANDTSNAKFIANDTKVTFKDSAGNHFIKDLATGALTQVMGDGVIEISADGTKALIKSNSAEYIDDAAEAQIFVKDLGTGVVSHISYSVSAGQPAGQNGKAIFLPDSNSVLYESGKSNGDGAYEIYLREISTGNETSVLGHSPFEEDTIVALSQDGKKVAFAHRSDDPNGAYRTTMNDTTETQILVKNLETGAILVASSDGAGNLGNDENSSSNPLNFTLQFSPDGTKILFVSGSSNLVAGDTNNATDLFVKNLVTGEVTRICPINGTGRNPIFSPDGTKVAFSSSSDDIVSGDNNHRTDVFIKDLITGEIFKIPSDTFGNETNGDSFGFQFSPDGKTLAIASHATNFVADDTNNFSDIFLVSLVEDKNLLGGSGKDTLTGAEGNDTISGLEANDKLYGGEGDDSLLGGSGRDLLEGDAGNDTLDGGIGNDTLRGGEGDDFLYGDSGNDTLYGGEGNDFLSGGNSADMLQGEGGSDTLYGGSAADLLRGGDGDDFGFGESGADDLRMGAGDDKLNGGSGADDLYGGIGADIFGFDNQATNGSDKVKDFSLAEGDKIYLEGLLVGFDTLTSDITEYVQFTYSATSSNLWVDIDGIGAAFSFDRIATLENVLGLDAATLYANGDLVVVT